MTTTQLEAGTEAPPRSHHVRDLSSRYALAGVWAAMALVYFGLKPHQFGSLTSVRSIFGSQEVLVFLAFSALTTLLVGEFDLSFASVMGLGATIVPVLAGLHHVNIVLACLAGILACALCGAVNAFFVVKLSVSSLVVTLGMGTLLIGIAEAISGASTVYLNIPAFTNFTQTTVLGMPVATWYGLALTLAFAYICGWTPLGRHMLFVGSSREVARLAGIRVNRVRAGSYIAAAVIAGLSGVLLDSSVGGYDPTASATYLLPALSAVFLGTAVVQPGQFNAIGTLIGIYFLETGIFGLQLLGFSGWIQDVFYGGGLVLAVALATVVRHRAKTA
jgi:ribose transport system permease protein